MPAMLADGDTRYFVQSETIRGEPRVHFVSERYGSKYYASEVTNDRRQAQRWCDEMNAGEMPAKT